MEIIEAPIVYGCLRVTTQRGTGLILITAKNNKVVFYFDSRL